MTQLTGTRRLIRLALRRDRIQLPVWLGALTLLLYGSIASTLALYPNAVERTEFAVASAGSAVVLAFNGLVTGASPGGIVASQTMLIMLLGAAVMSTFAVVRHTRQNEETGRAEMVGSAVVGRYALLAAALVVVCAADIVLGALTTLSLVANGLPLRGSLASGAAVAVVGIAFAALAALLAQVPESARAANGMGAAAVGAAFVLRAAGDATGSVSGDGTSMTSGWLSWLSPIGWGQQIRPYDDNLWWVLVLPLVLAAVCTVAAAAILGRRDLAAGLVPARRGPATASPGLLGTLGLAWRLQRGTFLGWLVGIVVIAGAYGAIGDQVEEFVGTNQDVSDLFTDITGGSGSLTDGYFGTVFAFLGIAVAAYAVQALLRLRSEENGPLESVLATGVSRPRWLASHVTIALAGSAALLVACGLVTGLTYGLVTGDYGKTGSLVEAGLVQLPAALVVAGLAVAAFGLRPRVAVGVSWGILAAFLMFSLVGQLFGLPQAVLDLSPFSHVPAVPAVDVRLLPLVALLAVGVGCTAVGFTAFRRRDIVP